MSSRVTETSMMFMIPMLPTRSETPATVARRNRQWVRRVLRRHRGEPSWARPLIMKLLSCPGPELLPLPEQRLDLRLRLLDPVHGRVRHSVRATSIVRPRGRCLPGVWWITPCQKFPSLTASE